MTGAEEMIDVTKYDRKNAAVNSIYKRLLPPPKASAQGTARERGADAVASEFDAGKGGVEPPPSVALEDGTASLGVDVPDVHGSAGRPGNIASVGEFSPGKNHHDLPDGGISSVADFVTAIQVNWQRGVDAFMSIARLCSEASARLTALQKRELIQALPFEDSAFSKFVQIGTDTRLYAPDIQRLLPPHYTTMYAVTLLTDQELKRAIAEKVLHPDIKRNQLQRWLNRHRAPRIAGAKEAASDPAVASAPIAATQDGVEGDALPTVSDDNRDIQEQLAVVQEDAPVAEAVATGAVVAGPLTPPPSDEEIPPFLDRRPMSAEDQRVFDMFTAAWKIASPAVRQRIKAEVFGADGSSRADAGIKNTEVVVRRKRRRRRKFVGSLDDLPF
jgi:hypothetical protein